MGNRGQAHRPIFETRRDARLFLAYVARAVRRYGIEVLAYTILTTHFHLLLRCPNGNLSAAMRFLKSCFTRRFNLRRQRDGAAFCGRFWSRPVVDLTDTIGTCRYIDQNPVRAGMVARAWDHEFSSAARYRKPKGPPWLARGWVEEQVKAATGSGAYLPEAYPPWRSDRPEDCDWVIERRERSSRPERVGFDEAICSTDEGMKQWFTRSIQIADGCVPRWPLVAPNEVCDCVARMRGEDPVWIVPHRARRVCGWDLIELALLRVCCGLTILELTQRHHCGRNKINAQLATSVALAQGDVKFIGALRAAMRRLMEQRCA